MEFINTPTPKGAYMMCNDYLDIIGSVSKIPFQGIKGLFLSKFEVFADEFCSITKFFFNTQQLVVFCDPV